MIEPCLRFTPCLSCRAPVKQAKAPRRLLRPCGWLIAGADLPLTVPPADPTMLPKIDAAQFQPYLQACASRLARFEAVRQSEAAVPEQDRVFTRGDGLAEALCVVPSMFFKDDFSLARWAPTKVQHVSQDSFYTPSSRRVFLCAEEQAHQAQ